MASHFEEYQDGGFNLLTIHDKPHKGVYYHRNTSGSGHNTPSQIIPPDELGVIGACTDIKKYLSLQPANAELYFYKLIKTRKSCKTTANDNNVDPQAIMNITLHHSMAGLIAIENKMKKTTEVNIDQKITFTEIPFNETTNIISSDNKSINKRSSEYQYGEYQSGKK
ncbi:43475_t:CDS:2, partial [Gigaspora margarita]